MPIKITHSPQEIAQHTAERLTGEHRTGDENADLTEDRKWANELLNNPDALMYANSTFEPQIIGEAIETRAWEVRETYEEDREPLWFLDLFRNRRLITEIQPGQRGDFIGIMRSMGGEIRYIGDKTDDWPTSGGTYKEYKANHYKHYAGSVEIGLLEQWEAARSGKDLVAERLRLKLRDIDEFNDSTIATGAPLHGIYGFALHPEIPEQIVPAGVSGSTEWPNKIPAEWKFDIQLAMESVRTGSSYNVVADILMLSDLRYTLISTASVTPEGRSFLSQLAEDFKRLPWAKEDILQPFLPFNTAGPGDTPMMLAGILNRETLEFPMMPTVQLAPEYHASKWKIGLVGAHGSIRVKRENRLQRFLGI